MKLAAALDLAKNEAQNFRAHQLAGAPSSPVTGQLYYNTSDNTLYWWNGTVWVDAAGDAVVFATPAIALGTAAAAGAAASVIRSDSTIAAFDATAPSTQAFSDAPVVGTVAFAARRDHKHGMPATPTHGLAQHQELIATTDLTDWPRAAALDLNSQKITSLLAGTAATDAVNLGQLNAVAGGVDWKASVRAASVANLNLASMPAAIDGVSMAAGERFLAKDQTTGAENGIYTWAGTATPATRATDADASAEVTGGMAVWVNEGTTNADTAWTLTTNDPITLATTALVFTQFGGLTGVTAGNALSKTGNTLDVMPGTGLEISADTIRIAAAAAGNGLTGGAGAALDVAPGFGIEISADTVRIAAAAAGAGLTGGAGAALDVVTGAGLEISADTVRIAAAAAGNGLTGGAGAALAVGAGTGITVTADAVAVDPAIVPGKYSVDVGDGAAVFYVITHNLGTRDVVVSLRRTTTPWDVVEADVEMTSTTTVTLRFSVAPTSAQYRVTVIG